MDEEQIQRMIAELLGKLKTGGVAGGANSLLDSPISPGSTSYNSIMGGDDGFLPAVTPNTLTDAQLGAGGDRGFATPAEREQAIKAHQVGLLPGTPEYRDYMMNYGQGNEYTLGIDGQEVGYNFTGDNLSEVGMAQFRDRNNITANTGGGSDSANLGFTQPADVITNLSSDFVGGFDTTRGLDTPAQRHSIGEIMGNLNLQEQNKVKMILQNLNDGTAEGRRRQEVFLNGMMDGSIDAGGYGVQDEAWPIGWQ